MTLYVNTHKNCTIPTTLLLVDNMYRTIRHSTSVAKLQGGCFWLQQPQNMKLERYPY